MPLCCIQDTKLYNVMITTVWNQDFAWIAIGYTYILSCYHNERKVARVVYRDNRFITCECLICYRTIENKGKPTKIFNFVGQDNKLCPQVVILKLLWRCWICYDFKEQMVLFYAHFVITAHIFQLVALQWELPKDTKCCSLLPIIISTVSGKLSQSFRFT